LKIVACEHLAYYFAPFSSRILRRIFYPLLDAVIVLTSADAKQYWHHRNVRIIPNSLSFIPNKYADLSNKKILAVGRLTYQKGFDLLINAISLIKTECMGWEVKIIGDGEDKNKLKKQIDDLDLNWLINIASATTEIVNEYLSASIYVMSSRYEGLPMVLIEAKSCGLPIVSFDCPEGPAEVINDGIDGILVENGNVQALGDAIVELIHNTDKRNILGANAYHNIEKYKSENIFKLWNDLFIAL
jgi:glycosyltransferase involved in cell wall biosynthesis